MKNPKSDLISVLLMVFIFFSPAIIGAVISYVSNKNNNPSATYGGFNITAYNVKLDVNVDDTVDVTETIIINWEETNHHGIFKFTPEWLKYTDKNGKTISKKAVLSDYRAIGDPYTVDTVSGKKRIKIGSASSYVSLGEKSYVIRYTYDMGKDMYKGFDEFIFHAYGDYWYPEIKNATLEINMPKAFDKTKVKFFTDKYRKNDVTDYVEINESSEDNQIIAYFNNITYKSYLNSSLTIDIELPDGYFEGGSYNYTNRSLLCIIISFILMIVTIIDWTKFGKDYKKRQQTVEFYAPDKLNPAEVGYIAGNKNMNKLTVSLMISLASKGYIKIDDLVKKKIQITDVLQKPYQISNLDDLKKPRTIEVKRLKSADQYLTKDEKTMMKYLFKSSNYKVLTANFDKFLNVKDNLVKNGYIEVVSDNLPDNSEYDKAISDYENALNEYNKKFESLPVLDDMEKLVYDLLFETENVIILSEHKTIYKAFSDIQKILDQNLKDKVHDSVATQKQHKAIWFIIISLVLNILAYFVFEDIDPRINILYKLSYVFTFVILIFTFIMKRKTSYGEEIYARVLGFKNFLVKAEKENLEHIVSENAHYFYDILAFAYVLGVSKKWISKFENIKMPEVDMGTFDFSDDFAYSSLSNVSFPAPTYSGGGGCSSCGGGCSSCGGGCSSCGGGGSW